MERIQTLQEEVRDNIKYLHISTDSVLIFMQLTGLFMFLLMCHYNKVIQCCTCLGCRNIHLSYSGFVSETIHILQHCECSYNSHIFRSPLSNSSSDHSRTISDRQSSGLGEVNVGSDR